VGNVVWDKEVGNTLIELRGAVHNGEFAAKLNFNAMPDTSSCKWGLILLPCESERTIPKQQAAGKHH